nr:hypothetical protein Iba_chr04cCG0830 [Ipomoea batatas]
MGHGKAILVILDVKAKMGDVGMASRPQPLSVGLRKWVNWGEHKIIGAIQPDPHSPSLSLSSFHLQLASSLYSQILFYFIGSEKSSRQRKSTAITAAFADLLHRRKGKKLQLLRFYICELQISGPYFCV